MFYLGKGLSIFSAELLAILKALDFVLNFPINNIHIVVCADSKAALNAIMSPKPQNRLDMITEINLTVHLLFMKDIYITFCWVPSHCGLSANERVDRAAKMGAHNLKDAVAINVPLDLSVSQS